MNSVLSLIAILLIVISNGDCVPFSKSQERNFAIDYEKNTFLKDSEPFRYVAGSLHYFRSLPQTWRQKLRTLRAAGLNAVTTYVEWSSHNPKEGVYRWDGITDLENFIKLAVEEDLYVILRPGPYICAERDLGGFPYWLLSKYSNIRLRTTDPDYIHEVKIWYSKLMPRIVPYLYGNGGPIIMVQIENEYGSIGSDRIYMEMQRDLVLSYVQKNAILFTSDGPGLVENGHIDGVLATINFGAGGDINNTWSDLKKVQPNGPLVNSEFYVGWLTHWEHEKGGSNTDAIIKSLDEMLEMGTNVNMYMFHGGTNFGFTSGANSDYSSFLPDVTSYDYDAPMDEAGDPTPRYRAIREVISHYLHLPNISVPEPTHKENYGVVRLNSTVGLLSPAGRHYLSDGTVISEKPLSFEALNQYSGLVLYEAQLPTSNSTVKIDKLHDRGYFYVDQKFIGILKRTSNNNIVSIETTTNNSKLQILVENQGRINQYDMNDRKGILSDVYSLPKNETIKNWTMTKYSFDDPTKLDKLINLSAWGQIHRKNNDLLRTGPIVFHGELIINNSQTYDTYLDTTGWGKGIAFINGFNLGRYWPLVGPQITLYVPKEILRIGRNRIIFVEYEQAPESGSISFTNTPILDRRPE